MRIEQIEKIINKGIKNGSLYRNDKRSYEFYAKMQDKIYSSVKCFWDLPYNFDIARDNLHDALMCCDDFDKTNQELLNEISPEFINKYNIQFICYVYNSVMKRKDCKAAIIDKTTNEVKSIVYFPFYPTSFNPLPDLGSFLLNYIDK